jgi:hypothetical protein
MTPEDAHKAKEPLNREWRSYKKKTQKVEALAGLHTSRQV